LIWINGEFAVLVGGGDDGDDDYDDEMERKMRWGDV
jgi:hypothetical protein